MILQRLVELYDRLGASGSAKLAEPGFSTQKISFCIMLEADGQLSSLEDLRHREGTTLQPRTIIVPGRGKSSGSGINPSLLWDNAEYLLGWSGDPLRSNRATLAFKASRAMHLALEPEINSPAYAAVCAFLRDWSPQKTAEYRETLQNIATHFGVFKIVGAQSYVHELTAAPMTAKVARDEATTAMCLITGTVGESARLHEPKIKGVANALSTGALLVSFNASAFESYGKNQSHNAPVSTVAVFKYTNALNHILSLPHRRVGLGDTTFVFWADRNDPVLEEVLAMLFGNTIPSANDIAATSPGDANRTHNAMLMMKQLRDGSYRSTTSVHNFTTSFYILGLSPNASRLSVRFWLEATSSDLELRIGEHLRDCELKTSSNERMLTLRMLVNATGRYQPRNKIRFDTNAVAPQLVGNLVQAVLTGAPYPQSLLATMVRRIRCDSYVGYERVSAIKAYLVRSDRLRGGTQEIRVELDTQNTDVAYRCGRLFALLEKVQFSALGKDLSSTIKHRYIAAASATPATIFPRLFRVNTYYLSQLKSGTRNFYTNSFEELIGEPFMFPRQLSLEQQGRFFIGYFQERRYRPHAFAPDSSGEDLHRNE